MKNISRESFIKAINFMQERYDKQKQIGDLFSEEFEDAIFWPYIKYESIMVKLLEEIMDDEQTQWISYYCWEKDFGRDKHLGNPTDSEGKEIPLSTAEDLWNIINNIYT